MKIFFGRFNAFSLRFLLPATSRHSLSSLFRAAADVLDKITAKTRSPRFPLAFLLAARNSKVYASVHGQSKKSHVSLFSS